MAIDKQEELGVSLLQTLMPSAGRLRPAPAAEELSPASEVVLHSPWYVLPLGGLAFLLVVTILLGFFKGKKKDPETESLLQRSVTEPGFVGRSALGAVFMNPMNLLLVFVPLGWLSYLRSWSPASCFLLNLLAILPLASLLGDATEELAGHYGSVTGGLLNATFGNIIELLLVAQSLNAGLVNVTKGTLLGSLLSNELLVLGAALFLGGLFDPAGRFKPGRQQSFAQPAASIQVQIVLFAAFVIAIPSVFAKEHKVMHEHVICLSRFGAVCALFAYGAYLAYSLCTHRAMLRGQTEAEPPTISKLAASGLLIISTLAVALSSNFLVSSIAGFTTQWGFSQSFIGVVILPIVGNACEHSTAVTVAMKDNVDLAISIALGSAAQVALLVLPFAVVYGWMVDKPMDLDFDEVNSWALVLSALLVGAMLQSGQSQWLSGALLLGAYISLAAMFFFQPDAQIGNRFLKYQLAPTP